MSAVAARAGTGKSSVYARWPTKSALVRAAAVHIAGAGESTLQYSGDLEADLTTLARATAASQVGPVGEALRGIVADASVGRPSAGEAASIFDDTMPVQVVLDLLLAAQHAGRLRAGPFSHRVVNLGLTLVSHYVLMNRRVPSEEELAEIVHDIWLPALER